MTVWSSASSVCSSVVPMTLTVRMGTRMSPSVGIWQRLMTVFTNRWFIAIMIPRPGRQVQGAKSSGRQNCTALL